MAVVGQIVARPAASVFAVLLDPETYPEWLVGCRDIRRVEPDWPAPGSRFHHRVGLGGPLTVADSTVVLDVEDDARLVLEVRARPFGRGRATFAIAAGDDGATTTVTLDEVPIGLLSPTRPLADPFIARRNAQSLRNLAAYLERDEPRRTEPDA